MRNAIRTVYYISAHDDYKTRANLEKYVTDNPVNPINVQAKHVCSPFELLDLLSSIDSTINSNKIIFDYYSFYEDKKNTEMYSQVIRDAIISHPEYDFYFDESESPKDERSIGDFIIRKAGIAESSQRRLIEKINPSFHIFNTKVRTKTNGYHKIALGKSNLFDASNLRWACLEINYIKQGQKSRNYKKIQTDRANNFAYCVNSDIQSTIINSYLLFANGYRVQPIFSTFELNDLNQNNKNHNCNALVIRNKELLFANEGRDSSEKTKYDILGYKYNSNGMVLLQSNYWDWNNKYYFLACDTNTPLTAKADKIQTSSDDKAIVTTIPGTRSLTINGIYRDLEEILSEKTCKESPLELERETSPTDINKSISSQEMIQSMIQRAGKYYSQGQFIYSALVARYSLEINNGFFPVLSAEAMYTLSLAENAIAVNNLLGKDKFIAEDAEIRVYYIKREVERLIKSGSYNLIHQIYSDCRDYCKLKERFQSEEVFIDAMAKLNDGGPCPLFKKLKSIFKD